MPVRMSTNLGVLSLIVVLSVLSVAGDYCLKVATTSSRSPTVPLALGLGAYLACGVGWYFALRYVSLATAGVLYGMTTLLLLVAVGVLGMNEVLTKAEWLGVAMAGIAILLASRFL